MKKTIGTIFVIVCLLGVLGGLSVLLVKGGQETPEKIEQTPAITGVVVKKTITQNITGPGSVGGSGTETLKAESWRWLKEFVAPLNTRIPAGTPLIEYSDGESLDAPYDLVITAATLPKPNKAITEEYSISVTRIDSMCVEMEILENDLVALALGQEVTVVMNADETKPYVGTITTINQVGTYNAAGSKFKVTITIPNDGSILIGMSASLSIKIKEAVDVLSVPVSAINDGGDRKYVLVSGVDGTTKEVEVQTGITDGMFVEVVGDLKEGDSVILNEKASGGPVGGMTGVISLDSVG